MIICPQRESGTFLLFFVAGLLPMLIFILSLSVDFSIYFRYQQKLQEVADQATLLAWRYLPYQKQAQLAARRFISSKGLDSSINYIGLASAVATSEKFNDEFEVRLSKDIPLSFISYLLPESVLSVKTVSKARATPRDIFIAFDRSLYMAAENPESSVVDQEYSVFFRDIVPFEPYINSENGKVVREAPTAFMTQLCFNRQFSATKRTAIQLYEYFSAAGRNGVAIGTFPGISLEGMYIIRPMLRAGLDVIPTIANSGEALPLQLSQFADRQDYYFHQSARLGASSWCAAAAANETSSSMQTPNLYDFLDPNEFQKIWKPKSLRPRQDIVSYTPADIRFNPDYQSNLTVKEVAWAAVVKNSTPETSALIQIMLANLLQGPEAEQSAGSALRSGLQGTTTKTAIILAGDVPYSQGQRFTKAGDLVAMQISTSFDVLSGILKDNPNLSFKILYILLDDSQRPNPLHETRERVSELRNVFEEINRDSDFASRLQLELIYLTDPNDLSSRIISTLVFDNNNKVLSY
jgi:hypothetical protein